jgi:hypothetical protein
LRPPKSLTPNAGSGVGDAVAVAATVPDSTLRVVLSIELGALGVSDPPPLQPAARHEKSDAIVTTIARDGVRMSVSLLSNLQCFGSVKTTLHMKNYFVIERTPRRNQALTSACCASHASHRLSWNA